MTCIYIYIYLSLQNYFCKSTRGQVYYKVHKWMSSSHKDALKLLKSTSEMIYYKVHKWTSSSNEMDFL